MTAFVLDASVALAWFIDKPIPAYAQRVRSALLRGARATVPALWYLEMANGFAVSERRGVLRASDVDLAVQQLEQLVHQCVDVSLEFFSIAQVLVPARKFRLSAYDAVYLEIAHRLQFPLATLDRSLAAAAAAARVAILR